MIKQRAKDYNEQMKLQREAFQKELLTFFHTGSKELFEAYPGLKAFSWSQGTPGYCDGDPCHFRVNNNIEGIRVTIDECFADVAPGGQTENLGYEELEPWVEDGVEEYTALRYPAYSYGDRTASREPERYTATRPKYKTLSVPGLEEFDGVLSTVSEFLGAFDNDVFETFSDPDYGATITLHRDGNVTVSFYDFGY